MIEKIKPNLYRIMVRLPDSPLRLLNSYVILGKGRNLLIDTGFNRDECYADLMEGIRELGISMEETDLFLTHFHADHCGLAARIVSPQSKIYIGADDKKLLDDTFSDDRSPWDTTSRILRQEGFPEEELDSIRRVNPAVVFATKKTFDAVLLADNDTVTVGDISLRAILTPGHTPGHLCLYWPEERVLFSGDHVLFDISPNIQAWPTMDDSLGDYLKNLAKIRDLDADCVLTGHRENQGRLSERVDGLLAHHEARLDEIIRILRDTPGLCGYDVAGRMTWSIRAKNWQEFPPSQKWFAVGEATAHLRHLRRRGLVRVAEEQGRNRYYTV